MTATGQGREELASLAFVSRIDVLVQTKVTLAEEGNQRQDRCIRQLHRLTLDCHTEGIRPRKPFVSLLLFRTGHSTPSGERDRERFRVMMQLAFDGKIVWKTETSLPPEKSGLVMAHNA